LIDRLIESTAKIEGDRGSTRLPEKTEELSRDQTPVVIAFITLEVTVR